MERTPYHKPGKWRYWLSDGHHARPECVQHPGEWCALNLPRNENTPDVRCSGCPTRD